MSGGSDSGGGDLRDELAEAVRQLEKQRAAGQKPPGEAKREKPKPGPKKKAEDRATQEDLQEAVEAIGRERREAAARRPRRRLGPYLRWIAFAVVLAVVIVAGVLRMRPEALPAPAVSAEGAVEGFWAAVIEGKHEAATVYYPALVNRYGSRKQAARYLEDLFRENPPIEIVSVGEAEELPDSDDLRVSYEVCLRNGRPRTGEFIVQYTGGPSTGYVIVAAP